MQIIPKMLLKQLYTFGSLKNTENGVSFQVKNRLKDSQLTEVESVTIGNIKISAEQLKIDVGDGNLIAAALVSKENPIDFPLRKVITMYAATAPLTPATYTLHFVVRTKPFGKFEFEVDDSLKDTVENVVKIPRDATDDYSKSAIEERQTFYENYTGVKMNHLKQFSFDPQKTKGNIEHLTGVAQIPIGIAGPILINGEHAQGEFIVPMATTEGTLVASYNRGMKVLNACGGVKCTVIGDAMQRAPVFVFEDARAAREFVKWVNAHIAEIREQAESTSSVAKLQYIDQILSHKFAYLRFNYSTGDAAGQNMVGRATFVACSWIIENYTEFPILNFYLESNLATDKKASQINIMRTRGKRVVAEALIKKEVLLQMMRVHPKKLAKHALVANIGSILSGANNNGLHSANGITAIFIATGQDVANVAESSAGVMYTELTEDDDLYIALTIPSLIIATYGGGTGLATQRECLELLDCYGKDKVYKLAEIIAGVVLAGEISLASAISSSDWVSSHEQYGRNR